MGSLDGVYNAILVIFWIALISTGAWIVFGLYELCKWLF